MALYRRKADWGRPNVI